MVASTEPSYRTQGAADTDPKTFHPGEAGLFALVIMDGHEFEKFQNGGAYSGLGGYAAPGVFTHVDTALASDGVPCVNYTRRAADNHAADNFVAVFACVAQSMGCRVRFRADLEPQYDPPKGFVYQLDLSELSYSVEGGGGAGEAGKFTLTAFGNEGAYSTMGMRVKAPLVRKPAKKSSKIFRVGIFLDFVRLTTRTMHPHGAYVRRAKLN